jgi:hypothetical protein
MIDPLSAMGEADNPGGVGQLLPETPPVVRNRWVSLIGFVVGLLAIGAWILLLWHWCLPEHLVTFAVVMAVTFFYLVVSYFVMPTPDYSNMGWFGGMADNPFRYSDDINRFLLFLQIMLLPGRVLAALVVNPFLRRQTLSQEARESQARESEMQDAMQAFYQRNHIKPPDEQPPQGRVDSWNQ